jgi:hypothetical protein
MKERLPLPIANFAASLPPMIEKTAGLMPTVSLSVAVRAATNVLFETTACLSSVVISGAMSLTSLTLMIKALSKTWPAESVLRTVTP